MPATSLAFRLLLSSLAVMLSVPGRAQEGDSIAFNQAWIEHKAEEIEVDDPMVVFANIFAALPERATVWPTENYYYFKFTGNGTDYSGNFRLHPDEREEGLINFAYFDTADPGWFRHLLLGSEDGVAVEKKDPMTYAVTFEERTVTFSFNPISQEPPDASFLLPDEAFVGRSFDESGITFLLVFSQSGNSFHWLLDPDQPAPLVLAPLAANLSVHVQSGFVFYQAARTRSADPDRRRQQRGRAQHVA